MCEGPSTLICRGLIFPSTDKEKKSLELDQNLIFFFLASFHPLTQIVQVINSASSLAGTERVVDVGSGHGHLSRLLSFGYGLKVTSIEAVGCHLTGAAKVDK